jgi:hypothetical protein
VAKELMKEKIEADDDDGEEKQSHNTGLTIALYPNSGHDEAVLKIFQMELLVSCTSCEDSSLLAGEAYP